MAQENKSKVSILTNGIIKENPVLRLVNIFNDGVQSDFNIKCLQSG